MTDLVKRYLRDEDGKFIQVKSDGVLKYVYKMVSPLSLFPGPKDLAHGDKDLGYFGWWNDTEDPSFITQEDVENATGLGDTGDSLTTYLGESFDGWLKFVKNEKILYVAKKPIRFRVTWDQIYLAGAVYGTPGDPGPYTTRYNIKADETNQDASITKNGFTYKIKLMTGGNDNPANSAGGDWNDLMYRVHEDDLHGMGGDLWDSFNGEDLHVNKDELGGDFTGVVSWVQETHATSSYPEHRIIRGFDSISYFSNTVSTADTSFFAWRPFLEIV